MRKAIIGLVFATVLLSFHFALAQIDSRSVAKRFLDKFDRLGCKSLTMRSCHKLEITCQLDAKRTLSETVLRNLITEPEGIGRLRFDKLQIEKSFQIKVATAKLTYNGVEIETDRVRVVVDEQTGKVSVKIPKFRCDDTSKFVQPLSRAREKVIQSLRSHLLQGKFAVGKGKRMYALKSGQCVAAYRFIVVGSNLLVPYEVVIDANDLSILGVRKKGIAE